MDGNSSIQDLRVHVNYKQILSIALPITFAILVPQLNFLINSIFLGRLGSEALGNAGITGVYYLIFAVAGNGLNNAIQTVFSKHAGAGSIENFKVILTQGIRISLRLSVVCILFTAFIAPLIMQQITDPVAYPAEMEFLKIRIFGLPFLFLFQTGNAFLVASLNSRYLMIGFIFSAGVNVLFDYLLIFGNGGFPKMGFNGAAVASIIAECSGLIVVTIVLIITGLKKRYNLLQQPKFHASISKEIRRVSLPLVSQYIISVTTWLAFFILIESQGATAKAISNTMRNVFGLVGVFVWAFASTSNVMVSNLVGQQREDQVINAIKKISYLSFSFCFILVSMLNLFPVKFFHLFAQDAEFAEQGLPVIRVVSLGILFMSIANIWLNGVTGTGRTKVNLLIELIAISFYLCYTWYFMKWNYVSLAVAWSNEFIYWTSIFVMAFFYLKSGKWKREKICDV